MVLSVEDFLKLRNELPVIDVRSEGEYDAGHIPNTVNIPLLNNEQRAIVGLTYKQQGRQEAIRTGFRLVGPGLAQLMEQAEAVAGSRRELIVHCWRGGMRSDYFSRFAEMALVRCHTLKGGYKAYRRHAQEYFAKSWKLKILGGYTGSGKTEILKALKQQGEQVIDLEALARHKGSVFGGLMMPPQPTSEQFENDLFEELLKLDEHRNIWVEDESIAIGKVFLPQVFWKRMNECEVIELNADKSVRVHRLVKEYAQADPNQFLIALEKIITRLGNQHYQCARNFVVEGKWTEAIDCILTYYDKAYRNGLIRKQQRIQHKIAWDGKNSEQTAKAIMDLYKENIIT
ncbi:MAG: tRNA 2-selenouridine(34) synthase MnmH [Cyclobacteriaceae bacterium]|nr:tRNA 2-selenouridine(34) synthase MnmH [Cyclobacteriaceae bacterium]